MGQLLFERFGDEMANLEDFEDLTEKEWLQGIMLGTGLKESEVYQALQKAGVTYEKDGLQKCHKAVMKYGPAIARNRPHYLN
jgi:hypothetical protein